VNRFGLSVARVVHIAWAESHAMVPRIGDFAARYLATILSSNCTLAIGWGSHIQAVALALPAMALRDVHVVQAVGSRGGTALHLVYPRLVESIALRIEATPHFLPAPTIAATVAERDAVARDPYFGKVLERLAQPDIALVGIGPTSPLHAGLSRVGALNGWELERVRSQGAVGEVLAEFFDIQGRVMNTDINRRVVGMRETQMRQAGTVLAVAGGEEKAAAILGTLRSGIVDVLVTDSLTTRAVLALADEYPTPVFAVSQPNQRKQTGQVRPDSDSERRAILLATLRELDRVGYQKLSPTVVAHEAHVAPERIFRSWSNRASLVGDAWRLRQAYARSCGETLREDLERLLCGVPEEEAATDDPYLAARTIAAEAQLDSEFRRVFDDMQRVSAAYVQGALERAWRRGELHREANLGILADMISGAIWYRLLIVQRPLDAQFASDLADTVLQMAAEPPAGAAMPGNSA
ncbi:MAG: TetR/AcrR family transcriptional regulator C-terminal ligand-binding domain-containing protein, partial [Thermomicrobiales bacterium]|nr:TetR/AcrR family transcriptional regulator C-terminal ligand-binding domain-containing protein [Thermomicrobiales bacterium]